MLYLYLINPSSIDDSIFQRIGYKRIRGTEKYPAGFSSIGKSRSGMYPGIHINKWKGFIMDLSKKLRIVIRLIRLILEVLEDEVSKTERERTNEKDNGHSYFSSY